MHQQGALAYQQTTKTVETAREREAALLIKAAANLQRARDNWNESSSDLNAALTFNRKIWTVFVTSVTREDNPLPAQIRQNIANIGIFIMKQTRDAAARPAPQKLDSLIQINRQLAAGLRGN
ncbi:MAG: hypothetical protein JWR39_861 [Devosia sp.]|jgi:flagellar protein FlaF|nr:hypothetical protein [Devosia sp.]